MFPTYIDIEASGLGRTSFPIEIAWNDGQGVITNRLIKPVPDWVSWDPEAAKIHGISRDELAVNGVAPDEACVLIRDSLTGSTVYSDAPELERFWLNRLFQAGENCDSPLVVVGVSKLSEIRAVCYELGLYDRLKAQAIEEIGVTHRADADVAIHMKVYELAQAYSKEL